jgi:hypothetical protein
MLLRKDLLALSKDLKALGKRVDMLLKAVDKKKGSPAKRVSTKKAAKDRTTTVQVLGVIKRYKKGVGVPTLKEKTGFNDKKVRNVIYRALKAGKIKRSGRGLYVVVK